ncbi:MAG: HAMP domain-containing protein [bacterium]|nr:HAMP domain-containing protein [bacterium]
MSFLSHLSVRTKVTGVILVATLLSLGTGFTLVVVSNLRLFEQDLLRTTALIAHATGDYNSIYLSFDEREVAEESLAQLQEFAYITDAHLYDNDGQLFASFRRNDSYQPPPQVSDSLSEIRDGYVHFSAPVTFEEERYGTIYVRGTAEALAERQRQHLLIMVALMAALVVVAVILAYSLQGFVSKPILHLAEQAQRISTDHDYSIRVEKPSNDEIGMLYDGFNDMLAQVQLRQEELERSNQDLDQFAYVASHDLKAPLRAIATLAGWIEEDLAERLEGEAKEQMGLLRSRVARMDALIEGVLQYSRAGRTETDSGVVDVGELLGQVIELQSPPAGFEVVVSPGMPTFSTNPLRLGQVFANLINNAIKYHDRSEGRVEIRAERRDRFYEFTVEDDGPGIAAQHHERIFKMFQTLQPRDEVESTGLGLALVKKLVEEEGGKIHLESEVGAGATFRFTWPITRAGGAAPGQAVRSPDPR